MDFLLFCCLALQRRKQAFSGAMPFADPSAQLSLSCSVPPVFYLLRLSSKGLLRKAMRPCLSPCRIRLGFAATFAVAENEPGQMLCFGSFI